MSAEAQLDDRGRITIHQAYRRLFRERVLQILTPHGVLLRPVPDTLLDRGRLPAALVAEGETQAMEELEQSMKKRSPRG